RMEKVPSEFIERLRALWEHAGTASPLTMTLSVSALALIVLWPRVDRRLPGSIVALFGATIACALAGWNIETIGTKFGGVPSGLPPLSIPTFRPDLVLPLIPAAFTVAM